MHHVVQVSTVLGVAVPEEREHNAWTEGVAIWVAVFVVSLVGERSCRFADFLSALLLGRAGHVMHGMHGLCAA
jgi:predicted aconitase